MKKLHKTSFDKVNYVDKKICQETLLVTFLNNEEKEAKSLMNTFHHTKLDAWSYENEYRVISFGVISSIVQNFHGFDKPDYELQEKLFQIRHLSFNTLKELSTVFENQNKENNTYGTGILKLRSSRNNIILPIPTIDSLFIKTPPPKKIILGWQISTSEKINVIDACQKAGIKVSQITLLNEITTQNYHKEIMLYSP